MAALHSAASSSPLGRAGTCSASSNQPHMQVPPAPHTPSVRGQQAAPAHLLRLQQVQHLPQSRVQRLRTARASSSSPAASTSTSQLPEPWPLDSSFPDSHSFASFSNWLVPGSVMVGRYPYCEPSRMVDREKGEAQMEKILGTGITTFVCLQAELPPQEGMKLGGVKGFLPYKATAELIKSALSKPPPNEIMNGLRNPSLDAFLPPRRRPIVSDDAERQQQFDVPSYALNFLHFPVEDLGVPASSERLQELVVDLAERAAKGEKLYIHCWGGRGRAGLVGACLLREAYGMGAEEALQRVQRAFDTRLDNKLRSPETDEQRAFVASYQPRRK